jgi:anti-sigma regulatory factor (Ser/Thr protein kinase)
MITRAPIRPTDLHSRRFRLSAGPAAAAEARDQVRAAIQAWNVPVDQDVALLLTSELVTNAIKHETGETITVFITCCFGHLRVDVHDTSRFFPVLLDASVDDEAGRGLMLVDTLAAKWGCDRTPEGKSVYFTLAFRPDYGGGWRSRPSGGTRLGLVGKDRPALNRPHQVRARTTRRSPRCGGPQG